MGVLSTTIPEIVEDADPAQILSLTENDHLARALELQAMSSELAILCAAIGVLARRLDKATP